MTSRRSIHGHGSRTWRWPVKSIDLIDASISANIAYGVPDASFERIQQAAQQADADRFIQTLPEGYETTVGSRGLSLSSGQRQRIGIARALLRDPELLILDEATNAVDGISEAAIMTLIQRRAGHKLTIVISHRPSTIASCQDGSSSTEDAWWSQVHSRSCRSSSRCRRSMLRPKQAERGDPPSSCVVDEVPNRLSHFSPGDHISQGRLM